MLIRPPGQALEIAIDVVKRQLVRKVGPHVALGCKHVRVDVDRAFRVILLSGAKVRAHVSLARRPNKSVCRRIAQHKWPGEKIEKRLRTAAEHGQPRLKDSYRPLIETHRRATCKAPPCANRLTAGYLHLHAGWHHR